MKLKSLRLATAILLVFSNCADRENDLPTVVNENSPLSRISLELIDSIGSDDPANEDYIFGIIYSLQVDDSGNLYVLDRAFKNIRVFAPNGKFLRGYDLPKGKGPGEFMRPVSMALSWDKKHIYVADAELRKLTILDLNFNFIYSFAVNNYYFEVFGGPNNTVIVVFDQLYFKKKDIIVHIVTETGKVIAQFATPHRDMVKLRDRRLQFVTYTFFVPSDSLLFLAHSYPYDISVYEPGGNLRHRFAHKLPFWGEEIRKGEFLLPRRTISGLAATNDSLLLVFTFDNQTEQSNLYAYDYHGRSRGEILLSDFKIGRLPLTVMSIIYDDQILYVKTDAPFPKILKFKISQQLQITNQEVN